MATDFSKAGSDLHSFEKPSLYFTLLDNSWPDPNLLLLDKIKEQVVEYQLQGFLSEMDYLDPFHSSFWMDFRTKMPLVVLMETLLETRQGMCNLVEHLLIYLILVSFWVA